MFIIKESAIVQTGHGCPSQWIAKTIDSYDVYIRLRHGYLYVQIDGHTVFDGEPDGYDGVMSTDAMVNYINSFADNIKII